MKKLFGALLALFASASFGTTTVPVQLLNPTGSSSGQAIVSTGSGSAPAWGGVGLNGIAAIAANTVLANATASSSTPTAFAMPSCSTSSSALNWTTSAGFTCNTAVNAATLGGATFAAPGPIGSTTASTGAFTTLSASSTVSGTGFSTYLASPPAIGGTAAAAGKFTTLQATGLITPASTVGIAGTTTNDSAQAGSWGEYQTATTSSVSMTSGTPLTITSVSLTAGDWDIQCDIVFNPAGTTTMQNASAGVSLTNNTLSGLGSTFQIVTGTTTGLGTGQPQYFSSPITRESLAATSTVYCVGNAGFGTSTLTANGLIRARRIR
ncbi:hypothetical protein [Paraburkholderia sacchari]|uniref:hypothetical protein n=1 Tax=Paraburkholderia sacchari TaxID=159450 RepID=UPI003D966DF0